MKFKFKNGLIWVSVEIVYSGTKIKIENCILDTGSATTAFDIDCVNFDYSKPAKIKRLFGIGTGTQEVISQVVDKVTVDDKDVENQEIEFGDFSSKIGINGFIGNDVLKNFVLQIDYKSQIIAFI